MSVAVARTDGITTLTFTTDPHSSCPPLCQILKSLCYSPVCCSVSQRLRTIQGTSQSVLGALHIMVGLLNIGLGAILCSGGGASGWRMDESLFPYWFGGVFILFGIISILSEKCPSPCLVILNVILNLAGVVFAVAAIVLYSINIANIWLWWLCHNHYYEENDYDTSTKTNDPYLDEKCLEGVSLVLMLMRGVNAVLIVLSVLELCVVISSAVLGIKALRSSEKREDKSYDDPQIYKPLLEEVTGVAVA